jgi:hypothetical protein
MTDYLSYDFTKRESCFAWLQKKAPLIGYSIVAFFGRTSSGKSSLVCGTIGAHIADISDVGTTQNCHFIRGIEDRAFQTISQLSKRRESLTISDADLLDPLAQAGDRVPEARVAPMSPTQLWPKPLRSCNETEDRERFGDLYVSYNGNRLESAFKRVMPPGASEHLFQGSRFTLYNVDRVTNDPDIRRRLLRTILVDTKGIDTASPSRAGIELLKISHRNVYCLPAAFQDNEIPAGTFENMMNTSISGESWMQSNYWKNAIKHAAPITKYLRNSDNTAVAVAAGIVHSAAESQHETLDPAFQRLWNRTTFVRSKLDESLQSTNGYQMALQDAGTALGYFVTKPVNSRVRHIAIPELSRPDVPHLASANEFAEFREELLTPRIDPDADLCSLIREYLQSLPKGGFQWKKYTPRFIGNSDEYYATRMWEGQKCSKQSPWK